MVFDIQLTAAISAAIQELYGLEADPACIVLQKPDPAYPGDVTLVVFGLVKILRAKPDEAGEKIGAHLRDHSVIVTGFNVVKGFLNLEIHPDAWLGAMNHALADASYGIAAPRREEGPVVVEYSSPNTNKPLHLGHVRNNLLGWSVAEILAANGHTVKKVNLVNDRGIHICKSMMAWKKTGGGETPATSGMKGDHFVGKYYVAFDKMLKEEAAALEQEGFAPDEAVRKTALMQETQQMLRQWEAGDAETLALWKMMNGWVYEGFDQTYQALGVGFDKLYYESQTYLEGKKIMEQGLRENVFFKKDDGSVWIDLTGEGLDEKLVLRADGTSVYITQDIGTASIRYADYGFSRMIYVVGNEQDYHFKVLKLIISRLGKGFSEWADRVQHLSYGMVDLPSGKMKSREGTVVDADDLIAEVMREAEVKTRELGKIEDFNSDEARDLYRIIGLGALKYYILKVDPKKRMLFDPAESIDIHGNTGPFIQYAYARIKSVLRKADATDAVKDYRSWKAGSGMAMVEKEKTLLRHLLTYPDTVAEAGQALSPALVANFLYETARLYNQFYHELTIVDEEDLPASFFRLQLSDLSARVIASAARLLGIEVPERM